MALDWKRLDVGDIEIEWGNIPDGEGEAPIIGYFNDEGYFDMIGHVNLEVKMGEDEHEGIEVICANDIYLYDDAPIDVHNDFGSWDVIHNEVIRSIKFGILAGYLKVNNVNHLVYLPDGPGGSDIKVVDIGFPGDRREDRHYYIDTEFTGLRKDTDLISVGISSPSGDVFYAELNDYDSNKVNDWIEENVIAKLAYNEVPQTLTETVNEDGTLDIYMKGNRDDVREAMLDWLERTSLPGAKWQFIGDVCQYDKMVIDDLFGGALNLPERMSRTWIDINDMLAEALDITVDKAFDISRVDFVKNTRIVEDEFFQQHNALNDAIIIQAIHESLDI